MKPTYAPDDSILVPGNAYRVLRVLGSGGMGSVYEVLDHNLGAPCVLKILHPELARTRPALKERFANEARVLARMRHRNLVRVLSRGQIQDEIGTPYYAMELLDGVSLRSLIERRGALRMDVAINLGVQIFFGVQATHDRGVVHRDIKPDNIIIHKEDGDLVAKIIDFGVMKLLDDPSPEGFCGTPTYAAPEQLRSETVTAKMDIFSAGAVFFELLTGHRPYEIHGVDERGALDRVEAPAPPITRYAKFPKALVDLVAAALSLDPGERPGAGIIGGQLQLIGRVLPKAYDINRADTAEDLVQPRERDVQPITVADLEAPTDPDGPIPPWMRALRENAEVAKILGEPALLAEPKPNVDGRTFVEPKDLGYAKTEPYGPPLEDFRKLATRESPREPGPRKPKFDTEPVRSVQPEPAPKRPPPAARGESPPDSTRFVDMDDVHELEPSPPLRPNASLQHTVRVAPDTTSPRAESASPARKVAGFRLRRLSQLLDARAVAIAFFVVLLVLAITVLLALHGPWGGPR